MSVAIIHVMFVRKTRGKQDALSKPINVIHMMLSSKLEPLPARSSKFN